MILLPFRNHAPVLGHGTGGHPSATVIGRTRLGDGVMLGALATLRADGCDIFVGDDCWFGDASTVHIADGRLPTRVGRRVTVGRHALLHACTLHDDCVVGDGAVVMDGAELGAGALLAAQSLVPPGKKLEGGWIHAGIPAAPVARVTPGLREAWHDAIRTGRSAEPDAGAGQSPLAAEPVTADGVSPGAGIRAQPGEDLYVAPTASFSGRVALGASSSVWFGTVLDAGEGRIEIGEGSNVQDNSRLHAGGPGCAIRIGRNVTVGHNVIMRACIVEDGAMVGMGSVVGAGTVVKAGGCVAAGAFTEPGTIVEPGWIWAGRPARALRPLSEDNAAHFRRGIQVYIGYARDYRQALENSSRQAGP